MNAQGIERGAAAQDEGSDNVFADISLPGGRRWRVYWPTFWIAVGGLVMAEAPVLALLSLLRRMWLFS